MPRAFPGELRAAAGWLARPLVAAAIHGPSCRESGPQFDYEDIQLDGNSLRELIYREMLHFHPEHRFH